MNRTILIILLLIVVVCGSGIAGIFIYKGITEKSQSEHHLSVDKIEKMGKLELVKINMALLPTEWVKRAGFSC